MPSKAVADAIEAYVGPTWEGMPVIGLNEVGTAPRDGSAFVVLQYPVATAAQLFLGRTYREEGAVRVVINRERGEGLNAGLEAADSLATHLRTRRIGSVRTWTPSSPVIDDGNDRGGYCQFSFAVPYTHDFEG